MCGLTGMIGFKADEKKLENSIKSLYHRGPDGNGLYVDDSSDVGLAHTRLSIIDLQTGEQPLYSEDKDIVLVCNGELYDFERIRSDLEAKGHVFSTKSDSEIVIHLYQEYGTEMFKFLRGEFCFVLYDKKNQEVIAAKDRFGIKPIYYYQEDNNFVFSSEAKGIFATGVVKPEIDPVKVRNQLSFVPQETIFSKIEAVPPGCFVKIKIGQSFEIEKYWDIDLPLENNQDEIKSFDDCEKLVQEKFDEAVRLRMRADVPVGVYLSGGIDSAAVAATSKMNTDQELHAFTISFSDDKAFCELDKAKKMAESINAKLHVASCDNDTLLKNLSDSLWYSELPTANLHGVGKFLLSELARKHVKVVLTGEGSDETFLGYEYFKNQDSAISQNSFGHQSNKVDLDKMGHARDIINSVGYIPQHEMTQTFSDRRQTVYSRLFSDKNREKLSKTHPLDALKKRIDRSQTDGRDNTKKIQYFSIKGMMSPYILSILGDRQEMAHSIEGRTPLLDHHLFEAARNIPDEFKIKNGIEKYVFRTSVKERVTKEIFENKKWPYAAPPFWVKKNTSKTMADLLGKYMTKEALEESGVFNPKIIRRYRVIHALLPNSAIKRRINALLLYILNIQILSKLYTDEFQANIDTKNFSQVPVGGN